MEQAYLWSQIRKNRRSSYLVMLLTAALLAITGYMIGRAFAGGEAAGAYVGLAFALVLSVVLILTSWFGGRGILMAISRARRIEKKDRPQLFNVVEEMAIASGLPVPEVYIIDDSAPNAFATGRDPRHAAVAITTGLLDKLDRDELQGVMAHEMSHVRNHDILFAMIMGVMVGSIALLCDAFLRATWYGSRGRRRSSSSKGGGQAQAVFLVLALLLAILAPIFAKLLQLAMSRKREYLADASAAELTRYPEGLARALEKISGDPEVLEAANRATQHLYIVNPIKAFEKRASSAFSTHPPIQERVRVLREMAHTYPARGA